MSWKDRRVMKLTNCGAETVVTLNPMPEVAGKFRLTVVERIVGGIPSTTAEQVYDEDEGVVQFKEICEHFLNVEYKHPDTHGAAILGPFDDTLDTEDKVRKPRVKR